MLSDLRIQIFADGASRSEILEMYRLPWIRGFTTNPTLMRKDGVTDYEAFATGLIREIPDKPLSFEVVSDDFAEMERQAEKISGWGDNVYVKIPISNTAGDSACPLIRRLALRGIKLNVTAIMTVEQVKAAAAALADCPGAFVSVFAGRIADSGRDPLPLMTAALAALRPYPQLQLLWASSREILNILQAEGMGCHIITVTNDLLRKASCLGRDLDAFSLDTVKMFHDDAARAGYTL